MSLRAFAPHCLTLAAFLTAISFESVASEPPAPAPEGEDSTIVIVGNPVDPKETRREAQEFVRRTGIAQGVRPAARWLDPVCPRIVGLSAPYDGIVEARLREIAVAVGIARAAKPCRANITISFVESGQAFMRAVASERSRNLREVSPTERGPLLDGNAPIRWFYTSETRSKDGTHSLSTPHPGLSVDGGSYTPLPVPQGAKSFALSGSGIVSTQATRALTSATVVVDIKRSEGLPLGAVAAYAALVAYAEMRPLDPPPADSILGLVAGGSALDGLSDWDLTLLRALYRMPLDRQARRHRGALVGALVSAAQGRPVRGRAGAPDPR